MPGGRPSSAKVGDAQSGIKTKSADTRTRTRYCAGGARRAVSGKRYLANADLATLVEEVSRTYGYGLLGSLLNVLWVLSLSSLPLIKWGSTVEESGTLVRQSTVPVVDRWGWGIFMFCVVPVMAFRATFAIASSSPNPMTDIESWECAPACLVGMLVSGSTIFALAYALPSVVGVRLEYYPFVDMFFSFLILVVGVTFSRMLMRTYHKWTHGNTTAIVHAASAIRSGSSKSKDSKCGRNNLSSSSGSEAASAQHVEEKRHANDGSDVGIFKDISQMANSFILGILLITCKFIKQRSAREKIITHLFLRLDDALNDASKTISKRTENENCKQNGTSRSHRDSSHLSIADNNRLDANRPLVHCASFAPGIRDDRPALGRWRWQERARGHHQQSRHALSCFREHGNGVRPRERPGYVPAVNARVHDRSYRHYRGDRLDGARGSDFALDHGLPRPVLRQAHGSSQAYGSGAQAQGARRVV